MSKIRVRAPLAMRIARVDRQKFNEAVADGFYGCAPPAERGSARVFGEDDLIALFYFGRLTDMGIPPRTAGHLACSVRDQLRTMPEDLRGTANEGRVSYIRTTSGMGHTSCNYDPDHLRKEMHYPGMGMIAFSIEFNVAQVRALIRREIQEEASILGKDEDE